jgi:serine/arginine repetitive matrix protein 2
LKLLLEKTPKQHVDHLPTVSLASSMKTVFRVMQEVKTREEEHDLIRGLVSAIQGLASASSLARRERRLLIRGSCRLLVSRRNTRSQRNSKGNPQSLVLLDAINNWDSTNRSEKRRSLAPAPSPNVHPNTVTGPPNKTTSGGSASGYDLVFSPVEVLVFSDVVVVATPTGKDRLKLVEKIGITRILNVAESVVEIQGEI